MPLQHKQHKTMMSSQQQQEKQMSWVIENLQAIEDDTLPLSKRSLFLEMLEENKYSPFLNECLKKFEETKQHKMTPQLLKEIKEYKKGVFNFTEKVFAYYGAFEYFIDWSKTSEYYDRPAECLHQFVKMMKPAWVEESDEDFRKRGITQKEINSRRLEWSNAEGNIEKLCNSMESWWNDTVVFPNGFFKITNPYMRSNGNCELTNLENFIEMSTKGQKCELWRVFTYGNYHCIVVKNGKLFDKSNGALKVIDLEYYSKECNMKIIAKYNLKNVNNFFKETSLISESR